MVQSRGGTRQPSFLLSLGQPFCYVPAGAWWMPHGRSWWVPVFSRVSLTRTVWHWSIPVRPHTTAAPSAPSLPEGALTRQRSCSVGGRHVSSVGMELWGWRNPWWAPASQCGACSHLTLRFQPCDLGAASVVEPVTKWAPNKDPS